MVIRSKFQMQQQPDDTSCGPTCLQSLYHYYDDDIELGQVIKEIHQLEEGGTLAVVLGIHALRRGYKATIYTYNLQIFDPSWFPQQTEVMIRKLEEQMQFKKSRKLRWASRFYLDYLSLGGELKCLDLTSDLIRGYLTQGVPILTGLSSTYLYRTKREYGLNMAPDDVKGIPQGHFVVITSYDPEADIVTIADPYHPNPVSEDHEYYVNLEHLVCAIMLGVVTYDANMLILTK